MRARELLDCGTRRITEVPSALPRQAGVLRDRGAHRHLACSEVTSSRGPVWCRDPAAAPASAFLLLLLLLLRHILTVSAASTAAVVNTSTAAPPSPLLLLPLRAFYVACRLVVLFFFRCDCGSSAPPAVGALDVPVVLLLPPRSSWRPPSNGTDCLPSSESVGRLSWRASLRNTV